jgi:hypothetical protein
MTENRVDLQPPPLLWKQHDKDLFQNQSDKEPLPLARLMPFPMSSLCFVYLIVFVSGASYTSHLPLAIKAKMLMEALLYLRNSLQMNIFQTLSG